MHDLRVEKSCQQVTEKRAWKHYKEIPDIHVPGEIHEDKIMVFVENPQLMEELKYTEK